MKKVLMLSMLTFFSAASYAYFCPVGGEEIYTFTADPGTHQQFFCTVDDVPEVKHKQIILYNDAEMISGFGPTGTFRTGEFDELKTYYFDAFRDTAAVFETWPAGHLCAIADFPIRRYIHCESGKGGRKDRFPGQYG